ncbi:hypothetical protein SAMN04490248_12615 [Salinihabitans flavidus]|uniref:Uncharacterized protein n=1 Tax=Salinihabitans flavidus TaxID=569882 RepID=A0A1H8V7F7_9RHOB|nr:hypothetical protein [Salinihabitans flavidus]SEP11402.1 hypothetical protein SAMN04490248_12615 [Salinihabitans flavidus]
MKPSVVRLIEGIVTTLRDDIVPHVSDPYARGQAVGVIDLLNNFGDRLEWDAEQVAKSLDAKRRALAEAKALAAGEVPPEPEATEPVAVRDLLAQCHDIDSEISDRLIEWSRLEGDAVRAAGERLRRHMHDELEEEMKMTKRPLFAEIAKGG